MAIKDWSTTAASNLTVGGVSIAEGMSPAGVNNAMRAIMAEVAAYATKSYNVVDYGASGGGATDDTSYIAAAITAATSTGGTVYFPPGTYLTDTITLPSKVILRGAGHANTKIKLNSGINAAVIQTTGFASLTGNNKWLTSDNVCYGFGIIGLTVDGNKAAQSAGNAINFYGKRYVIDDVMINDAYAVGLYTEAGATSGQTDETDMPECYINNLWVFTPGSHGIHYRGPHDGYINSAYISQAGGKGFYNETSSDYSGSLTINNLHAYSCTEACIDIYAGIDGNLLIGESGKKEGVVLRTPSATTSQGFINSVRSYSNDQDDTSTYYNVVVGAGVQVGSVHILDTQGSAGGINFTASNAQIGSINIYRNAGTDGATALNIATGANQIHIGSVIAQGVSGTCSWTTGINVAGNMQGVHIVAHTQQCLTHIAFAAGTKRNNYIWLYGYVLAATETALTGTPSTTNNDHISLTWLTFTAPATNTVTHAVYGQAHCSDATGNFAIGPAAGENGALATTATDGFLYIPSCAGTPTGVPTTFTGRAAIVYDSTNNKLYVYEGGWKGADVS